MKNINVHVFNLNKQITQTINARLELYDITRSEIPYLTILYQEENITQEQLSKILGYNEGTVTRALKRLESKGIVKRIPSLKDRRKKIVCLTEEGIKRANKLSKVREDFEEELYSNFTQVERDQLNYLIEKLQRNIYEVINKD